MITFKNSTTTCSGKRIEVFDGPNIFNINIEYYEKDNIFEMDNLKILHLQNSLLPLHYEFRCFKALNDMKNITYNKKLTMCSAPKRVQKFELLIFFKNGHLQLLENINNNNFLDIGWILEETSGCFIISNIFEDIIKKSKTLKKSMYNVLEDIVLDTVLPLELTFLVKINSFNQITDIYYTTNRVLKKEFYSNN